MLMLPASERDGHELMRLYIYLCAASGVLAPTGTYRAGVRRCVVWMMSTFMIVAAAGCSAPSLHGSGSSRNNPDGHHVSPPASVRASGPEPVAVRQPAPGADVIGAPIGRPRRVVHLHAAHTLRELSVPPGHGARISLTFDDGPSPTSTPAVISLLASYHVHATFCLIGYLARRYAWLAQAEARAGHVLCDHTRDHKFALLRRGGRILQAEIDEGLRDVRAAAPGAEVRFFRQPGGLWSTPAVRVAVRDRLQILRWDDDPRDWSRPGIVTIAQRVVSQLRRGGVVLMHDGGGDRKQTVAALAWLLPHLRDAGWVVSAPTTGRLPLAVASSPQ